MRTYKLLPKNPEKSFNTKIKIKFPLPSSSSSQFLTLENGVVQIICQKFLPVILNRRNNLNPINRGTKHFYIKCQKWFKFEGKKSELIGK